MASFVTFLLLLAFGLNFAMLWLYLYLLIQEAQLFESTEGLRYE